MHSIVVTRSSALDFRLIRMAPMPIAFWRAALCCKRARSDSPRAMVRNGASKGAAIWAGVDKILSLGVEGHIGLKRAEGRIVTKIIQLKFISMHGVVPFCSGALYGAGDIHMGVFSWIKRPYHGKVPSIVRARFALCLWIGADWSCPRQNSGRFARRGPCVSLRMFFGRPALEASPVFSQIIREAR